MTGSRVGRALWEAVELMGARAGRLGLLAARGVGAAKPPPSAIRRPGGEGPTSYLAPGTSLTDGYPYCFQPVVNDQILAGTVGSLSGRSIGVKSSQPSNQRPELK